MADAPDPAKLRLSARTLDGKLVGSLEASGSDRVLSLALRLRDDHGAPEAKLPQLIWQGAALRTDSTVAEADLRDEAELHLVWLSTGTRPPSKRRSHTNVLDVRAALDDVGLSAALAEVADPDRKLNLAGSHPIRAPLAEQIAPSLLALDIRQCRMGAAWVEELFAAIPEGLAGLEASRNAISRAALERLAGTGCRLKVLDVGCCDLEDNMDDIDLATLQPLLGEQMEELGLSDVATPAMVEGIAACCPNLRKLDVNYSSRFEGAAAENAWREIGARCPRLEEVHATWCDCPAPSMASLLAGCPRLHTLALGPGSGAGLAALADRRLSLNILDVEVRAAEEVAVAAQLDVQWLVLRTPMFDDDQVALDLDSTAAALRDVVAGDVELHFGEVSADMLRAVGPRLRAVGADAVFRLTGLLPGLALAAAACHNLLELSVALYEQVAPEDLATVAANCPLLERVMLNADERGFQREPIDIGVEALGLHCSRLSHLDLYDRTMREPARTLAAACHGWPLLRYLCAAGTWEASDETDWTDDPQQLCLPQALAAHCPRLEELVLYGVPVVNKYMFKQSGKDSFHMRIRVHPFHVLRQKRVKEKMPL